MGRPKLHCFCWKPSKGFMVRCDECKFWFHGSCIGQDKRSTANVLQWFCRNCQAINNKFRQLQDIITLRGGNSKDEVADLKQELTSVKGTNVDLLTECQKLRDEKASINAEVADLKQELTSVKGTNVDLLTECQKLRDEKASINAEVVTLKERLRHVKSENLTLSKTHEELEGKLRMKRRSVLSLSQQEKKVKGDHQF